MKNDGLLEEENREQIKREWTLEINYRHRHLHPHRNISIVPNLHKVDGAKQYMSKIKGKVTKLVRKCNYLDK